MKRRRETWIEKKPSIAEKARDGFQRGVVTGMIGMGLAGLTEAVVPVRGSGADKRMPDLEDYLQGSSSRRDPHAARLQGQGPSLHDAVMDLRGWPAIRTTASCWSLTRMPCSWAARSRLPRATPTT
ncbi:MAG: hypothetical protein QM757_25625 [Paludibaculum sp.]